MSADLSQQEKEVTKGGTKNQKNIAAASLDSTVQSLKPKEPSCPIVVFELKPVEISSTSSITQRK